MPSTDIDGSLIVVLSEEEARRVYEYLETYRVLGGCFDEVEERIARKIAANLNLPHLE